MIDFNVYHNNDEQEISHLGQKTKHVMMPHCRTPEATPQTIDLADLACLQMSFILWQCFLFLQQKMHCDHKMVPVGCPPSHVYEAALLIFRFSFSMFSLLY